VAQAYSSTGDGLNQAALPQWETFFNQIRQSRELCRPLTCSKHWLAAHLQLSRGDQAARSYELVCAPPLGRASSGSTAERCAQLMIPGQALLLPPATGCGRFIVDKEPQLLGAG